MTCQCSDNNLYDSNSLDSNYINNLNKQDIQDIKSDTDSNFSQYLKDNINNSFKDRKQKIKSLENKFNYIIYHRKCLDGFTGFFLFQRMKLHDRHNTIIYPDVPSASNIPPNIDNRNIIIIDVAYKYEILREITSRAKSVLFIDHHITISEDVKKIKANNLKIIYNLHKSGASLVWDYFYNTKMPLFVRYIEDNDIGIWKIKYVHEFITALQVLYDTTSNNKSNLTQWEQLFDKNTVKQLINRGKIYMQLKTSIAQDNSTRVSIESFPSNTIYQQFSNFFTKPGQYKVAVYCGSPCPSASDVAKEIFKNFHCDFFISWVYNMDRKEFNLTFRSEHVDVGSIAKLFNGGGHKLAAACSFKLSKYDIKDLFFHHSLQRIFKSKNKQI